MSKVILVVRTRESQHTFNFSYGVQNLSLLFLLQIFLKFSPNLDLKYKPILLYLIV